MIILFSIMYSMYSLFSELNKLTAWVRDPSAMQRRELPLPTPAPANLAVQKDANASS